MRVQEALCPSLPQLSLLQTWPCSLSEAVVSKESDAAASFMKMVSDVFSDRLRSGTVCLEEGEALCAHSAKVCF